MPEHISQEYLHSAKENFDKGYMEKTIGACKNALHYDCKLTDAFILMAEAYIKIGYIDQAIQALRKVVSIDGGTGIARNLLSTAIKSRNERNREIYNRKEIHDFRVLKVLGIGWEGAVYLVRDSRNVKYVVKKFHPYQAERFNSKDEVFLLRLPVKSPRKTVIKLINTLNCCRLSKSDTLYPIQMLRDQGKISGIFYKYQYLIEIKRKWILKPDVSSCLFGTFLRTQAYLLRKVKLCMSDAKINNFMITFGGYFKFIDYGISIIPTNDFRCNEDHWHIRAMVRFLNQLFWEENLLRYDAIDQESICFEYNKSLSNSAVESISKIDRSLKKREYGLFLDYRFYEELADGFPKRLPVISVAMISLDHIGSHFKNYFSRKIS